MSKLLHVEIITPTKIVYSGDVVSFTAPGTEGRFQVLYNHTPFLSSLAIGPLKVLTEQKHELKFATSGGFTQVLQNKITVLAETAEKAEGIDVSRAQEARTRAEERLSRHDEMIDEERAKAALMRAINRLRVAGAL